jgi:hypothetical protein
VHLSLFVRGAEIEGLDQHCHAMSTFTLCVPEGLADP